MKSLTQCKPPTESPRGLEKMKRGLTLKTIDDVRRLLGRLIRMGLDGTITSDRLRALTYASTLLVQILENHGGGRAPTVPFGWDKSSEYDPEQDH